MIDRVENVNMPVVSVILAVYNERQHVASAIQSLLEQRTVNFELEILVIDGCSEDGSDEIVRSLAAKDDRVRLLVNPRRKTPYAFNIGLHSARGEYVCILGAHAAYPADYIAICLNELKRTRAVGCSGKAICCPANPSWQARLVSLCLSHPFGTSPNSVRTHKQGFVDTIPYPVFEKRALTDIGGYDEQLFRNQDNDLNQRLREHGYKLYLTERVKVRYFVSSNLSSLARYAFKTGYWNVISYSKNKHSMSARHFIPFAFVMGIAATLLPALTALMSRAVNTWLTLPLLIIAIPYVVLALVFSLQSAFATRDATALLLPIAWLVLHMSYGCGTAVAIAQNAKPPHATNHRAISS